MEVNKVGFYRSYYWKIGFGVQRSGGMQYVACAMRINWFNVVMMQMRSSRRQFRISTGTQYQRAA